MPPIIAALPLIAAIGGIASAGTTIGLDLANSGGPSTPKPVPPTGPTPAQQQADAAQKTAAVGQQLPTIEGLTSGYANPEYYGQQGALAAGVAGESGGTGAAASAVEKAFGLPPGTLSGVTGGGGGGRASGTPSKFTPAGTGGTNQGAFPTGETDLSSFVNTFFRG
jgi:hypothetical protein